MPHTMLKSNYVVDATVDALYSGGPIVASASHLFAPHDSNINMISLKTGERTSRLQSSSTVTCMAIVPKGDRLVSFHQNLLLQLWEIPTGGHVKSWKTLHRGPVTCATFCHFEGSKPIMATGSVDFTVRLWDLDLGYCTCSFRDIQSAVVCVEFLSASVLAVGSGDGKVRLYDPSASGVCRTELSEHTAKVTAVCRLDEKFFASAGADQVIVLWNYTTEGAGALVKSFPVFEPVTTLLCSNKEDDGLFSVLFGCESGRLEQWTFSKERVTAVKKLKKAKTEGTSISDIRPVPQAIDVESNDCSLIIATESHNLVLLREDFSVVRTMSGFNDEVFDIALMPSTNQLLLACNSNDIRVYNYKDWSCELISGHSDMVLALSSFDHILPNVFASASKDNDITVWRLMNRNSTKSDHLAFKIASASGHTASVSCVSFCRKAKDRMFLVSAGYDMTLKVWNLPSSLNESIDANSEDGEIQPLKLSSACTVVAHDKDITCLDITPNDKFIATGSMDKTVKIWALEWKTSKKNALATLEPTMTMHGHKRGIWGVKFSSKDQIVGTASGDGTVKLFALVDGACIRTFEGHDCAVLNVLFFPSGLQILSTDTHGLMKMWNIKTSECVKTWDNHDSKIWALCMNEDASVIYSGGADSKVLAFRDVTAQETEEETEKSAETVQKEQKLMNLLEDKKHARALELAINLDRPFTALTVIKQLLILKDGSAQFTSLLSKFDQTTHERLIKYAVDWNVNTKHCHVAQLIVSFLLSTYRPDELLKFKDFQSILEALLPYTERHLDRLSRLKQESMFVDYIYRNAC